MSSSSLSTSAVPSTSAHIKSFLHGRAGKAIACTTTTTSNSIVTSTTAIGNESSPIAVFTNSSHTPAIDISETCANGDNANLIQPFSSRGQSKLASPPATCTTSSSTTVITVDTGISSESVSCSSFDSERANVTSIVTNTNTIRTSTTTITTTTTTTKNVNRIRSKSITHLISSGARSSPIDENNNDDEKNSSSNNNNNNQLRKRLSPLRVEDIRRSFENKSLNHCDRNIETNGVVRSSTHSSYKSKSNTNHNVQRLGPKSVLNNGDSVPLSNGHSGKFVKHCTTQYHRIRPFQRPPIPRKPSFLNRKRSESQGELLQTEKITSKHNSSDSETATDNEFYNGHLLVNKDISSGQSENHFAGIQKSDSLDSSRAVCCTKLAFNIYNKALESAKKALPLNKQKENRHQFPRSFGEDFGSLGPDAFNYLDDSMTECSGSYKDIDFNRDSYYISNDTQIIPEESEQEVEAIERKIQRMEEKPDVDDHYDQQPNYDLNSDPSCSGVNSAQQNYGSIEQDINIDMNDNENQTGKSIQKKGSFIGRMFRKRDRSVDKDKKDKGKTKKSASRSRECSTEKSSYGYPSRPESVNLSEVEKNIVASLEELHGKRTPSPDGGKLTDDDAVLSNVSRQSPVHLVYGQPPDIFVEECRTLPQSPEELATHTSRNILNDVFNEMYNDPSVDHNQSVPDESNVKVNEKDSKRKKFMKKFNRNKPISKEEQPIVTSTPNTTEHYFPETQISIHVTEPENVPPQNEEEFLDKPLPELPTNKNDKQTKPKRLFLKKDNFKLKDRFKIKKRSKDMFKPFTKRHLSDVPESKHSTLNSINVNEYTKPRKEFDNNDNVVIEIGQPLVPGLDYSTVVDRYSDSFSEKIEELKSKMQMESNKLNKSSESLEVPPIKPVSPPPKVVDTIPIGDDPLIDSDHPVVIGSIAVFERIENVQNKEIGVTYEPEPETTPEPMELPMNNDYEDGDEINEPKQSKKIVKLKNMMGSFSHSVKAKVDKIKDKVKKHDDGFEWHKEPKETFPVVASTSKDVATIEPSEQIVPVQETNLDVVETNVSKLPESSFSFRNFAPTDKPTLIPQDSLPEESYELDAEDEAMAEPEKKKKVRRKFKLTRNKKPQINDEMEINREEISTERETEPIDNLVLEPKQSWASKNRKRLERIRSRATESFKEVKERIVAKTKRKNRTRPDPDMYEYEFKFASDSELSPGTGVDSLRRSKVYKELADAQERLELYMSPVGVSGPLRPPRSKQTYSNESFNNHRSMPSLAMSGRRLPPPPRPPPPKLTSYHSVPAIEVMGDEISLSTSMSSLWQRPGSRRNRRAARRQRVPADIYYRNVRLGFRPKKRYMEMLEKSQDFYSMANLHRTQSLSQIPTPPDRKQKGLAAKRLLRATTSPPPPNSRASLASNYGEIQARNVQPFYMANEDMIEVEPDPILEKEKELYEKYEKPKTPTALNNDPLNWEPFSWKVKRCRSLTEIDVRGQIRSKQPRPAGIEPNEIKEVEYQSTTPSEYGMTNSMSQSQPKEPKDETYSQRILSWLASTSSLDTWRRHKRDRSVPNKPPRPPPPIAPMRTKISRPSTPTSSNAFYFPYSFNNSSAMLTQTNAQISTFAGRPLPPPPVPPRPKLIPAHYAIGRRVETCDASVDTSENGFLAYHCSEKEIQVKLPSLSRPGSIETPINTDERKLNLVEETNLDEDDEVTIVGEVHHSKKTCQTTNHNSHNTTSALNGETKEPETITSASVYTDARSRLTGDELTPVARNNVAIPAEWSDDDDTINDDLSSLSSNYQSLCASNQTSGVDETRPHMQPELPTSTITNVSDQIDSWLYRQQPFTSTVTEINGTIDDLNVVIPELTTIANATSNASIVTINTNTTTDEYVTAMDDSIPVNATLFDQQSSNLNHPVVDDEILNESYEEFRRTFANTAMTQDSGNEDDANQRQSSFEQEDGTNQIPEQGTSSSDAKRNNRESMISTGSSVSADSPFSIFHVNLSSSISSYSFESTTSSPSASIGGGINITGSTTSAPTSTFYVCDNNNYKVETSNESNQVDDQSQSNNVGETGEIVSNSIAIENNCPNLNHQTLPENISRLPKTTPNGAEPDKRYFIAHELYITERDYVDVLKMLTEEFRDAIKEVVPDYFLNKFFRPLDQVLPINQKLLNDLEQRVLVDWDQNPRISDIMIKICPYFKEYSIFVREFESLNLLLDEAQETLSNFLEILQQFQNQERCKKLTIKNYLLKPIQRLPQYPLLLRDYLKRLKPDDPDYKETEHAIQVVTKVVEHVNRESLMAEKAQALNNLKNRIITKSQDSIVKPGREVIKMGILHKVSRKEVHERFFILFNDALLYLVPVMNEMLRLNDEFPLDGMDVEISNQADNEFVIRSFKRSFALMARDSTERKAWVDVLEKTISEYEAKRNSFQAALAHSNSSVSLGGSLPRTMMTLGVNVSRNNSSPTTIRNESFNETDGKTSNSSPKESISSSLPHQVSVQSNGSNGTERRSSQTGTSLGERAPVWVHDRRVTMCQRCMRQFTILFRRHHCRACGLVVCTDCSGKTYPLKYRKLEPQRVCDICFDELSQLHPEWLTDGPGHHKMISGSTRVSPNNSLSAADFGTLKGKMRSNSCTDIVAHSVNWSEVNSKTTPAALLQPDHNHNPILASLTSAFNRNQKYRLSARAANIPAVLIEVPANDPNCTISGYMSCLTKKNWKRYWFLIKDMVLYTYRASEDVAALESHPLPGYKVSTATAPIKGFPASMIIELSHSGRTNMYFFTETPDAHERWLKAFRDCAELH